MSVILEPLAEDQFKVAREGHAPEPIPRELLTQIYVLSAATSLKRIADALTDGDSALLTQLSRIEFNTREVL